MGGKLAASPAQLSDREVGRDDGKRWPFGLSRVEEPHMTIDPSTPMTCPVT